MIETFREGGMSEPGCEGLQGLKDFKRRSPSVFPRSREMFEPLILLRGWDVCWRWAVMEAVRAGHPLRASLCLLASPSLRAGDGIV